MVNEVELIFDLRKEKKALDDLKQVMVMYKFGTRSFVQGRVRIGVDVYWLTL